MLNEKQIEDVYSDIFDVNNVEDEKIVDKKIVTDVKKDLFNEEKMKKFEFLFLKSSVETEEKVEDEDVKGDILGETIIPDYDDEEIISQPNDSKIDDTDQGIGFTNSSYDKDVKSKVFDNNDESFVDEEKDVSSDLEDEKELYYIYLQGDSGEKKFLKTKVVGNKISFEKEKEILLSLYKEVSKDDKIYLIMDKNKVMVSVRGKLLVSKTTESTVKSIDEINTQYNQIQASLLFEKG